MTGELARAVRESLADLQDASGEAAVLRRRALLAVRRAAEADIGTFYDVVPANGGSRVLVWDAVAPESVAAHFNRVYGSPTPIPQDYSRPRPQWARAFLNLDSILGTARRRALQEFVEQEIYGHGLCDQLRLLAYDRNQFVGWIGAFRSAGEPPFAAADGRRLAPVVPAVRTVLAVAARRYDTCSDESAADIVVDAKGHVQLASASARVWLACPGVRDALTRAARTWRQPLATVPIAGVEGHVVRLEGKGTRGFLVHLPPIARVRRAATLSPAQSRIAELAAAGATVPEIARAIGRATETVRTHMRAIYERLEVGSRLELARALADTRQPD